MVQEGYGKAGRVNPSDARYNYAGQNLLRKSGWEEDDAGRHSDMIENGGYSASE